jgi:FimV-like protein
MKNNRTSSLIGAARLFLLCLVLIGSVDAVTLGQARVESFLNQPLRATIPLMGLADGQHRDLRLRLANQDDFERLGIAYEEGLADLQFAVVRDSGEWVVRVTTRGPVREPFLDFPLQLSWSGGRLVRQYSLLLDPVSRPAPIRDATVAEPAPVVRPAPAATGTQAGHGGTDAAPGAPVEIARDTVQVARGDTLWLIAERVKPAGITTRQMAMALLRANPEAFIDGNLNRLRAGADLQIPPLGLVQQLDASAARNAFSAEIRRWRQPAIATPPRTLETVPGTTRSGHHHGTGRGGRAAAGGRARPGTVRPTKRLARRPARPSRRHHARRLPARKKDRRTSPSCASSARNRGMPTIRRPRCRSSCWSRWRRSRRPASTPARSRRGSPGSRQSSAAWRSWSR